MAKSVVYLYLTPSLVMACGAILTLAASEHLVGTYVMLRASGTAGSGEVVGVLDHDGDGFFDLALRSDVPEGPGLWIIYGRSCRGASVEAGLHCSARLVPRTTVEQDLSFADHNQDGFDDILGATELGGIPLAYGAGGRDGTVQIELSGGDLGTILGSTLTRTPRAGPAAVMDEAPPPYAFFQLTQYGPGTSVEQPSISAHGKRIAFMTNALDGENIEIGVWDAYSGSLTQLTHTPSGFGNFHPMIHPDGTSVVFVSTYDFDLGRAGRRDLWEVDIASGALRRLTRITITQVQDPRLSGNGEWLVFTHGGDLTGQNPDNSVEIFRLNRNSLEVEQITVSEGPANKLPDINHDGKLITFDAVHNYDGTNPEGTNEIWLWEGGSGSIRAVTRNPTTLLSRRSRISGDGRYIAFLSAYDFVSGTLGGGFKVFLVDLLSGSIRLLTSRGTGAPELDHDVAPDGSRVLFESDVDLVPNDGLPTGRQLYAYDISSEALVQVTRNRYGASKANIAKVALYRCVEVARDTNEIAYRSEQVLDPRGANPDANFELFLGRPLDVAPPKSDPPTASAGSDQQGECSSHAGDSILLDGSPLDCRSSGRLER